VPNLEEFARPTAILLAPGKTLAGVKTPVLDLSGQTGNAADFTLENQDFGLILFTSGTTGNPKGAVHTKASLGAKILANLDTFGAEVLSRSLCPLSTHFVAGLLSNILTPLAAGGEVFLFPDPGIAGAARVGPLIDDHHITMVNSVPSLWNIILKSSKPPGQNTLKLVSIVSASLNRALRDQVATWAETNQVFSLYGTTESGGWNSAPDPKTPPGSVGKSLGCEAALLNPKGGLELEGEGELLLKGPSVFSGYLNRPDFDREAFYKGWFKTGDLAGIDKDGFIFILGRQNLCINRAGIKIVPEEIEALLEHHPGIAKACVFPYDDPVMGEGVAALIEPSPGGTLNPAILRAWCQPRVRAVSIPEKWHFTEKMPLNERGKLDRREIVRLYAGEGKP